MDIAGLSMAMSQYSVQNAVSTSVMKMSMESGEQSAAGMQKMMDSSDPNLGNNIDVRA